MTQIIVSGGDSRPLDWATPAMIKGPLKLIGHFAAGKDLPLRYVQYSATSLEVEIQSVSAPSTKVRAHCCVFGKRPSHSLWREPSPKLTIPPLAFRPTAVDLHVTTSLSILLALSTNSYLYLVVQLSQQLDFNDLSDCFRIYKKAGMPFCNGYSPRH